MILLWYPFVLPVYTYHMSRCHFLRRFSMSCTHFTDEVICNNRESPRSLYFFCYILIIKANEMRSFSNLFDKVLYMFRTCPLSIIRSIPTLYTRNRSSILTTLADANRTRMTNTYCVYSVLRYSWRWTVDMSEICIVLYEINLRKNASRWLSLYRGADKSLARPDWKKKQFKNRHFSSEAEVNGAAQTWLDGQFSEFFFSGLQKLKFGRCRLFPSLAD